MVGRTDQPNSAQRRRLDAISKMRCVCCEMRGVRQPNQTEVHHMVDKGTRALSGGHDSTLPLCAWHHRGVIRGADGSVDRRDVYEARYGPSMALQKRAFVEAFGTERALLGRVDGSAEVIAASCCTK